VPLFTQVYKWEPVNLILGEPFDGLASHPREGGRGGGGTEILLFTETKDKHRPDGPPCLYADFTLYLLHVP